MANGDSTKIWEEINEAKGKLAMIQTEIEHLKDARKNMRTDFTPRELCTEYRRDVSEKLDDIKEILKGRKDKAWQIVAPIISSLASALLLAYILHKGI